LLSQSAVSKDFNPEIPADFRRPPRGVEIVLEVGDIDAYYEHVKRDNYPLAAPLQEHPWGARDFRLLDPDGYYLRLTSRARREPATSHGAEAD
jgi:uncharacterized glyoxalase superfamily protein PhnB